MTLHIYGQEGPDEDVCIVGTQDALNELALAIIRASTKGHDSFRHWDARGRLYKVNVLCADDDAAGRLKLPYDDEGEDIWSVVYPVQLMPKGKQ